jgi:ATP-dependent DNA helicase DinG
VIVKVPFPYLGDRQVSARLRLPGGQTWYNVQVVRSIVQMTGRGVRNAEDWAETFILDKDFLNIYNKSRRLFPSWWRDAVNMAYPTMTLRAQHVG